MVHGILDNQAAHKHPKGRARHPRVVFHFVPTSCSWLNAVVEYFAKRSRRRPIVVHVHPADVQGAPDLMVDLLRKARGVSKVFADGGTRGSTRRDRLKERTLPDLLEIVGKVQ